MMHRNKIFSFLCWLTAALSILACRCGVLDKLFTPRLVRALPDSASDVQYYMDNLGIDFAFCMKARLSEPAFEAYRQRFGVTPHTADRVYQDDMLWLDWQFRCDSLDWWDPTDTLAGTYVRQDGDVWTFMKLENGFLFVKSISH